MYELAMLEWLVIAIIVAAGIHGCVVSGKEVEAVEAASTNAVRNQSKSGEVS